MVASAAVEGLGKDAVLAGVWHGCRASVSPAASCPHHCCAPVLQVAMSSLESTLLKWSVKGYLLNAALCQLANGDVDAISKASAAHHGMPRRPACQML